MFIDPDGRAPETDYKLLRNGEVQRVNLLDDNEKDRSDTLLATDSRGNIDKNRSITVAKDKPSDGSIISGLSEGVSLSPRIFGQSTTPYFSEGFNQNLNEAFNVYNFLDNNTNSGIEFSLANYNVDGQDNFQIATMHDIDGSHIKSNRFSNDNLIWSVHNHDGSKGLDYKNIGNQWGWDKISMNEIFRNYASKELGFPRFFTVNDNNRMIEITRTGQNTSSTQPFNAQFLKSLKRVYGSKKSK
ncbi:JAB-like toxin 1 domain-containing protein [Chryseobacterium sp.]|uniref:JAB-like toxin 1 domain-containing protein n=1 Tax=Chryseobacterium sp. TaxID=1871047 RepID=UPI003890E678